MAQDRLLELPQLRRRLEPLLLDEHATRTPVRVERIRLTTGRIQGAHQLAREPLAQRMLGDERLDLRRHARVVAQLELRLEPVLGRSEPQRLEPRGGRRSEGVPRELAERRPAPQSERLAQNGGRLLRAPVVDRCTALEGEPLEPVRVDQLRFHDERVGTAVRMDRVAAEDRSQVRHEHVERIARRRGRLPVPEILEQALTRHGPVHMQEQVEQERPLLPARDEKLSRAVADRQRA